MAWHHELHMLTSTSTSNSNRYLQSTPLLTATMPPKKTSANSTSTPSKPSTQQQSAPKSTLPEASLRNPQDAQQILHQIYTTYLSKTPQRTKLLDAFMFFLMVVGVIQFVYCVVAGNYVSCDMPAHTNTHIQGNTKERRIEGRRTVEHGMLTFCFSNSPSTPS